jgi:hypothetical protein
MVAIFTYLGDCIDRVVLLDILDWYSVHLSTLKVSVLLQSTMYCKLAITNCILILIWIRVMQQLI